MPSTIMELTQINLGKICTNFAATELLLKIYVSRLINDDLKIGAILTSEMSFQNIIKAFDVLVNYKLHNFVFKPKLVKLIPKINAVEQERNKLIHSVYSSDVTGEKLWRSKSTAKQGKGLQFQQEHITPQIFDKVIKEIFEINNQLRIIYKEIFNEDLRYG